MLLWVAYSGGELQILGVLVFTLNISIVLCRAELQMDSLPACKRNLCSHFPNYPQIFKYFMFILELQFISVCCACAPVHTDVS